MPGGKRAKSVAPQIPFTILKGNLQIGVNRHLSHVRCDRSIPAVNCQVLFLVEPLQFAKPKHEAVGTNALITVTGDRTGEPKQYQGGLDHRQSQQRCTDNKRSHGAPAVERDQFRARSFEVDFNLERESLSQTNSQSVIAST